MVRRTVIALLTLVVVATPAHAQTGKVLLDMAIHVVPDTPSGHCLYVDAGRFLVEGRLTGDSRQPVRFSLGPAPTTSSILDQRFSTPASSGASERVGGGLYCYALVNEDVMATDQEGSDRPPVSGQAIAVRLIWLPVTRP